LITVCAECREGGELMRALKIITIQKLGEGLRSRELNSLREGEVV